MWVCVASQSGRRAAASYGSVLPHSQALLSGEGGSTMWVCVASQSGVMELRWSDRGHDT